MHQGSGARTGFSTATLMNATKRASQITISEVLHSHVVVKVMLIPVKCLFGNFPTQLTSKGCLEQPGYEKSIDSTVGNTVGI